MSRLLMVFGLVAMVVGLGCAGYGAWTIWQQHRIIASAVLVDAKVLSHDTKDLKASGFKAKIPLVKYEYTVDGKSHTAETVTPSEFMLPDTWADSVFQQFPVGAETKAYYDPADPSQAFLVGKYSMKPYLPVLVGLVIAAMGLGVIAEQLLNRDAPATAPTRTGAIGLVAKQHHLTQARVFGFVGLVGLVFGAPAIAHHLSVSTSPHERMGFLLEGAYAIAVVFALVRSALSFRQGGGFGTPVVTIDRAPTLGHPLRVTASIPTRFEGTAQLRASLKCETKDNRIFSTSEENLNAVLSEQQSELVASQAVRRGDELAGTAEFDVVEFMPPSSPVDSNEKTVTVWSLILTAEGNGGRKAETTYILSVAGGGT